MTTYTNQSHSPTAKRYGPPKYQTDATPIEYRGYLIYERIKGLIWDVVLDGACLTEMAGPNGAMRVVDELIEEQGE